MHATLPPRGVHAGFVFAGGGVGARRAGGGRAAFEDLEGGGFPRVRRAAETPFNIVLEARA